MISMEKDWEMLASSALANRHLIILYFYLLLPHPIADGDKGGGPEGGQCVGLPKVSVIF